MSEDLTSLHNSDFEEITYTRTFLHMYIYPSVNNEAKKIEITQ